MSVGILGSDWWPLSKEYQLLFFTQDVSSMAYEIHDEWWEFRFSELGFTNWFTMRVVFIRLPNDFISWKNSQVPLPHYKESGASKPLRWKLWKNWNYWTGVTMRGWGRGILSTKDRIIFYYNIIHS